MTSSNGKKIAGYVQDFSKKRSGKVGSASLLPDPVPIPSNKN